MWTRPHTGSDPAIRREEFFGPLAKIFRAKTGPGTRGDLGNQLTGSGVQKQY
jgi:hypothetical protein